MYIDKLYNTCIKLHAVAGRLLLRCNIILENELNSTHKNLPQPFTRFSAAGTGYTYAARVRCSFAELVFTFESSQNASADATERKDQLG